MSFISSSQLLRPLRARGSCTQAAIIRHIVLKIYLFFPFKIPSFTATIVVTSGGFRRAPPSFLDQTEKKFDRKNLRPFPSPPHLSQGLDDRDPSLSEGLDPPLVTTGSKEFSPIVSRVTKQLFRELRLHHVFNVHQGPMYMYLLDCDDDLPICRKR